MDGEKKKTCEVESAISFSEKNFSFNPRIHPHFIFGIKMFFGFVNSENRK